MSLIKVFEMADKKKREIGCHFDNYQLVADPYFSVWVGEFEGNEFLVVANAEWGNVYAIQNGVADADDYARYQNAEEIEQDYQRVDYDLYTYRLTEKAYNEAMGNVAVSVA
jgi:hypothetical protein